MHLIFLVMPSWAFLKEWEDDESMFCCIPLRTGVFLNAFLTIYCSVMMVLFKQYMEDTMRPFSGGYALQSRVIIRFIEVSGILWGIIGVLGTLFNKVHYVTIYNYYQMVRVTSWLCMYWTDVPLMWDCEMWRTDINGAIQRFGWNPVMYTISMGGTCHQERQKFLVFSTLFLFLFIYLMTKNQALQDHMGEEPRYLLRVPKQTPAGEFFTESMAQRPPQPPVAGHVRNQAPLPSSLKQAAAAPVLRSQSNLGGPQAAAGRNFVATDPFLTGSPVRVRA